MMKLCASKYSIERSQYSAKNDVVLAENDLTNFGNLVEILWHRVREGNRNFENHVQNSPRMPLVLLLQFSFFVCLLVCFCSIAR